MTETTRKLMNFLITGIILICFVVVEGQEPYASPKLGQLVPTIRQQNYELRPEDDKYYLRLTSPYGGTREEHVELLTDKNGKKVLTVKGSLNLVYRDTPLEVTVIYEADGNGYRAKYMYVPVHTQGIPFIAASLNLLKSAVG